LRLPEAEQALQEGAGTFPADSRLWLAAGAVAQAAARFTPPEARAVATRPAHVKQRMRAIADRRARRMEAQLHFERALQQEAGLHEAAIRLAEVRLALGRPQEACDALSALPEEIETVLSYVAHLMRGRCHEKLERWPSAIESYRRATALWPAAETGWLALARALDHVGDRGGSQAALARVFATDRSPSARDPFRLFPVFCSGGSEALWGALLEGLR
jgi:tetratricopeptide (TPR) repeat protein